MAETFQEKIIAVLSGNLVLDLYQITFETTVSKQILIDHLVENVVPLLVIRRYYVKTFESRTAY